MITQLNYSPVLYWTVQQDKFGGNKDMIIFLIVVILLWLLVLSIIFSDFVGNIERRIKSEREFQDSRHKDLNTYLINIAMSSRDSLNLIYKYLNVEEKHFPETSKLIKRTKKS